MDDLEQLSAKATQVEDDIRYYSGGSKRNEPLEQLKERLVNAFRAGELVPATTLAAKDAEIAKMRKALVKSASGWRNAVELGIIQPQHVMSATILAEQCEEATRATGADHD